VRRSDATIRQRVIAQQPLGCALITGDLRQDAYAGWALTANIGSLMAAPRGTGAAAGVFSAKFAEQ